MESFGPKYFMAPRYRSAYVVLQEFRSIMAAAFTPQEAYRHTSCLSIFDGKQGIKIEPANEGVYDQERLQRKTDDFGDTSWEWSPEYIEWYTRKYGHPPSAPGWDSA